MAEHLAQLRNQRLNTKGSGGGDYRRSSLDRCESPQGPRTCTAFPDGGNARGRPKDVDVLERFGPRLVPFLRNVATQLMAPELADIILRADGNDFHCHLFVLACGSTHFERLLQDPTFYGKIKEAAGAEEPYRLDMLGKTKDCVEAVLRILYFEATTREILMADSRSVIEIFHLAREWELVDVVRELRDFVRDDVHDSSTLSFLVHGLGYEEETRELREICEHRMRRLTEEEETRKQDARRDQVGVIDFASQARSADATARWPAVAQSGRRVDHWSSPTNCPRNFGW